MKNIYLIAFLTISAILNAQIITFQDANFKNRLVNTICFDSNGDGGVDSDADINNDGEIDQSEAFSITNLSVNYANISSLSGIEYFSNIVTLNCYNNNLTTLDLSSLTNLTDLNCNSNQLTSLNINNLSNLHYLKCSFNQLTNLNFVNNLGLTYVICSNNLFTNLNICGTAINFFWCNDNPNLQNLTLKNGVISNPNKAYLTPPPLPIFNLFNLPALTFLCYDEGELPAITSFSSGFDGTGVTLVTDCNTNCLLPNLSNPIFENYSIKIFPNPTNHKLYLESDPSNTIENVAIYNTLGQLIVSKTALNDENSIDVSELNSGSYFISLQTTSGRQTKKFIKL